MNPFQVFDHVKQQFKAYITTFQTFRNPRIKAFVQKQMTEGDLLWKAPIIQISKKFKLGKELSAYVDEGILHPEVLKIFQFNGKPMRPYFHQQQAIDATVDQQKNLVVTTGTGSGKSFCFELPVIDYCLKNSGQGGIKAVIIYPMNALANSQYQEMARKLKGTGLKIGLYTGDTAFKEEDALNRYLEVFGEEATPLDCEMISRESMQKRPPDILITNYVQLELLLTRLHDRQLFLSHPGSLNFLVLDEMHTYSGKRGTDVAFLIRRLKQRTNTQGRLRCIGTSATMTSEEEEDGRKVVADFAHKLFGEVFYAEHVVIETEDSSLYFSGDEINPQFEITTEDLLAFEPQKMATVYRLYKGLMGTNPGEANFQQLGRLLQRSKTLAFIEEELSKQLCDLHVLAEKYQREVRPNFEISDCKQELLAGFLLGIAGEVQGEDGRWVPRFVPKINTFFSQGKELFACLVEKCGYISAQGETTCPNCSKEGRGESTLYPLHFCRTCGQEYYGMTYDRNSGQAEPWAMSSYDTHQAGYYTPDMAITVRDLPPTWLTEKRREVKKRRRERVPISGNLDSQSNVFDRHYGEGKEGAFIPHPFPFCPQCGTEHSGNVSENTKLFRLNSIGRATGTNVLATAILEESPEVERKLIGFSDNRQDAAFQAGHINDWYNQIYFRRALREVLLEAGEAIHINKIPALLVPKLFGDLATAMGKGRKRRSDANYFQRYVEKFIYVEIRGTKRFTSINLEDVGLIQVKYESLEELAGDDRFWQANAFQRLNKDALAEYLHGVLDIFRTELAIGAEGLIDQDKFGEVTNYLERNHPDKRLFESLEGTKAGGFTDDGTSFRYLSYTLHALRGSFRFSSWIRKVFDSPDMHADEVLEILDETLAALLHSDYSYLQQKTETALQGQQRKKLAIHVIDPDAVMLCIPEEGYTKICPKCRSMYSWKKLNHCIRLKCKQPLDIDNQDQEEDYYTMQYKRAASGMLIRTEDHSGQISGQQRKKREKDFKEGSLQFLIATPTMELGIDIGTLSSVYMRNVPPNPSNYAQRAGRAGRSGQGALISTFCGTGRGRGAHDHYFYQRPVEIVAGKIAAPRFRLENETLFFAHLNSMVLQLLDFSLDTSAKMLIDFNDPKGKYPMIKEVYDQLTRLVNRYTPEILSATMEAFTHILNKDSSWIDLPQLETRITRFPDSLDQAFSLIREDYAESQGEIEELNRKLGYENEAKNVYFQTRRKALEARNQDIRNGEGEFYIYRYLSKVGFLPNYAFPRSNTQVRFQHKGEEISMDRDQLIGISEYAPFNILYYGGLKYQIRRTSRETDLIPQIRIRICSNCKHSHKIAIGTTPPTNCSGCGQVLTLNIPDLSAIPLPNMKAQRQMRITSDEEERNRGGYEIYQTYEPSSNRILKSILNDGETLATLSFERTGTLRSVNVGRRVDVEKDGEYGFSIDLENHKWLSRADREEMASQGKTQEHLLHHLALYVESQNDVLYLELNDPHPRNEEGFSYTLLHILLQATARVLNLEDNELNGFVQIRESAPYRIIIFESAEGGTGILQAVAESSALIRHIAQKALEILHIDIHGQDEEGACLRSCYHCICTYYNQRHHELFDRRLVRDFLLKLSQTGEMKSHATNENHFEHLWEQCESTLERNVLKAIREVNLPLPDAAQKLISHSEKVIAKVDFFYSPILCLMIDGPDHDTPFQQKKDLEQRNKLKSSGKRIFVIRYDDELTQKLDELKVLVKN